MTKKRPARKKRRQSKKSSNIKVINLILIMLVMTLSVTIASYFLIFDIFNTKKMTPKQSEKRLDSFVDERLNKYFDEKETQSQDIDEAIEKIKAQKQIEVKRVDDFEEYTKEFEKDYIDSKQIQKEQLIEKQNDPEVVKESIIDNRPKLSIVIDDVTLQSQVNKILDVGYTINMSFLPPTARHKNSAKIAKQLPFYMIHLPLQAKNFKSEEANTLHVGDSYSKIEKRVKSIRGHYPNAIYTNNHTGSKFTSDDASMDKLIKALKKYDFIFVDSRTTAHSVVKKYTQKYDMPYIARNIFLDNHKDFNYIQNQLKKSIRIAKKTGTAIAIGHPYPITIQVLKESKHLLEGLNLVYINELPIH